MTLSQIPSEQYEETLKAMRERCYRAIKTMNTLQAPMGKGFPRSWAVGEVVRSRHEDYGGIKRRFVPSPRDLEDMPKVMDAIAWYKAHAKHGERDYRILVSRAFDRPWYIIAEKYFDGSVSERSLRRWLDRAVCEIVETVGKARREVVSSYANIIGG